jgi:hypothetical protein
MPHAAKHFQATNHPVVRSAEPGIVEGYEGD